MYKCKYCYNEFDSPQQLGGHIGRCKGNPNTKIISLERFNNMK